MERPLNNYGKGDIIITPFPFTDWTNTKRRPALIIKTHQEDAILLLITSKQQQEPHTSKITPQDFTQGKLHKTSYVKTNRIFTIDKKLIIKKAGTLNKQKTKEIQDKLITLLTTQN